MAAIKIDKIIRSKRRSIALIVMPDASLVIRAPLGVSIDYINGFVMQKSRWIEQKQKFVSERTRERRSKNFVNGEKFFLAGSELTLCILKDARPKIWVDGQTLNMTEACLKNPVKFITAWYAAEAKRIIPVRVKMYAGLPGYKYRSIRINSAKTRWGSCGYKNTLNFSWRLVMAPIEIIDYVIVHELVHIEVKNHSKRFYDKLEELMPDYRFRERWFKENFYFAEL